MDLATILKDYPLVIPAVATVIVAILGYFFVRWNSDRTRKLERRIANLDMRIKEARKYVDNLNVEVLSFRRFYDILLDGPSAFKENFDDFMEEFSDLSSRIQEVTLNASIINIINDSKLRKLDIELSDLFIPIMENNLEVFEELSSQKKVDFRGVDLEKLVFPDEVDDLITKMKIRLDELAKKTP